MTSIVLATYLGFGVLLILQAVVREALGSGGRLSWPGLDKALVVVGALMLWPVVLLAEFRSWYLERGAARKDKEGS